MYARNEAMPLGQIDDHSNLLSCYNQVKLDSDYCTKMKLIDTINESVYYESLEYDQNFYLNVLYIHIVKKKLLKKYR